MRQSKERKTVDLGQTMTLKEKGNSEVENKSLSLDHCTFSINSGQEEEQDEERHGGVRIVDSRIVYERKETYQEVMVEGRVYVHI